MLEPYELTTSPSQPLELAHPGCRKDGRAEGEGSRRGRGRVRVGRLRPPRDSVLKTESRGDTLTGGVASADFGFDGDTIRI